MRGIVQMPALMADAMALAEGLREETPIVPAQEMLHHPRALSHALHEPVAKVDVARRVAVRVATARHRVAAEARLDLARELGRPRPEAVLRIVRAPLDELHAVEARAHAGQRHVEHGHAPACAAEMIPERLALQGLAGEAPPLLVRAGDDLHPREDAVARGVHAGLECRPRGAGEEPGQAHRATLEASREQSAQVRQASLARPVLEQEAVARVDGEQSDAARHALSQRARRCTLCAVPYTKR
jgi:hypothetical protein